MIMEKKYPFFRLKLSIETFKPSHFSFHYPQSKKLGRPWLKYPKFLQSIVPYLPGYQYDFPPNDPSLHDLCLYDNMQRERGQWAVYYTRYSPKFYNNVFLFVDLTTLGTKPLILIYRRGNFVCHHCWYTSIYQPLSYPFRSLDFYTEVKVTHTEYMLM